MPFIIEITDREFDVENVTNALKLPAEREYVGHLTVDSPNDASITFEGDVQLARLDGDALHVQTFDEATGNLTGEPFAVPVEDIRRIEFY
jgi:hypothetical protein